MSYPRFLMWPDDSGEQDPVQAQNDLVIAPSQEPSQVAQIASPAPLPSVPFVLRSPGRGGRQSLQGPQQILSFPSSPEEEVYE